MAGKSLASLVALALSLVAGRAGAEEVRGRVKSVDPGKATITMEVHDTDRTYPVAADAKFLGRFGKKAKKATTREIAEGLKGIKEGSAVVVTTEKRDDKDTVARVEVEGLQPKKKKKKAD